MWRWCVPLETCHEHSRSSATLSGWWLVQREVNLRFISARLSGLIRYRVNNVQHVGKKERLRRRWTWAFGRCRCAQAGWTGCGGSVCVGHEIEVLLDRV